MALSIASNFSLEAQLPNFARDMFDTVADMKAFAATSLPDIFITTVKGDGVYVYKVENTEDAVTGKWRKLEGIDAINDDFEALKTQVEAWQGSMDDTELAKSIDTLISEAIAAVVDDAPEAFDTLKEIASWIGDDTLGAVKDLAGLRTDIDNLSTFVGEFPKVQKKDEDGKLIYKDADGAETTVADGNTPVMVPATDATTVIEYIDSKTADIAANGVTYTDAEGAVKAIGGWEVGDKADKMSFQDFAYKLLHPYVAQEVTLSISPSALQDKTAGGVSSVTLTANVTKHTNKIVSVTFYAGSNVIETLTSGVENGGSFTSTYEPASAIADNTTFKVVVSDGKSTGIKAEKTLSFAYPSYVGITDATTTVTADNLGTLITAGTLSAITLQSSKGYTQTYTGNDVRAVYVYDSSKGALTSIKDSNNFQYLSDFSKTSVTYNGTTYFVYQKKVASTNTNFKFIYA